MMKVVAVVFCLALVQQYSEAELSRASLPANSGSCYVEELCRTLQYGERVTGPGCKLYSCYHYDTYDEYTIETCAVYQSDAGFIDGDPAADYPLCCTRPSQDGDATGVSK